MDQNLKQYFEPAPGLEQDDHINLQVWRKSANTGKMERVRFKYGITGYFVPGERIYIFMKLAPGTSFSMKNEFRVGFGFHARGVTITDPVNGIASIPATYTFQNPQHVKLDGQPCDLWDHNDQLYNESAGQLWPAPNKSLPRQGHKIIDNNFVSGSNHYLSFEYTIPDMVWDGAFTYGSGSTGSGGTIGATARGFAIEPIAGIDVRYVLDSDYRKAVGIDKPEAEQPIEPRKDHDPFSIIEELEDKQLSEMSPLYSEEYGALLFPTTKTLRAHDENGAVQTYTDDFFKYSASAWRWSESKKPTYQELIKDIPGYRYVADDFEQNKNDNYGDGSMTKLPKFSVVMDGAGLRFIKHFYVTYEKLPEPMTYSFFRKC